MGIEMKNSARKPLRVWPGVVIAILLLLIRFVGPAVSSQLMIYGVMGGLASGVLVVLWWVFFSRAAWLERLGAVVLMAAALFATSRIIDVSIRAGGMGFLFPMMAIPVLSLAFVAWAVA